MKLKMDGICKSFGSNEVLKSVGFQLSEGEICALLGENGAGKSTLMNILGGVLQPDSGEILLDGKKMKFDSPAQSLDAGIAFIHQELNLINDLPIYENMFIGRELKKKNGLLDHKRMIEELGDGVHSNAVHLCGDSSRHFVTIRDELNVKSFDTGYPIDHAKMAEALGPDVRINGGPHVELLRLASAPAVKAECRRILESVKPFTRRFVLREGNNLPPGVPLENLWAMYEAAEEYGAYTD